VPVLQGVIDVAFDSLQKPSLLTLLLPEFFEGGEGANSTTANQGSYIVIEAQSL